LTEGEERAKAKERKTTLYSHVLMQDYDLKTAAFELRVFLECFANGHRHEFTMMT